MQAINATPVNPRRLIIPHVNMYSYAALYEALNTGVAAPVAQQKTYVPTTEENRSEPMPAYHKVRRGETLAAIADKYGVDVQDLKAWNHLHHNKAVVGQRLIISHG